MEFNESAGPIEAAKQLLMSCNSARDVAYQMAMWIQAEVFYTPEFQEVYKLAIKGLLPNVILTAISEFQHLAPKFFPLSLRLNIKIYLCQSARNPGISS